jgi:predicted nucleic acid-binding protein
MVVLFDTSVLVAGFVESHPEHKTAIRWFTKMRKGEVELIVASHSLVECYAVLTKLPLSPKILPSMAHYIISENIVKLGKVVSLVEEDYLSLMLHLSKLGLSGGIIYDAVIMKTAEKAKAKHVLTFNFRDFVRLCPENEAFIITP